MPRVTKNSIIDMGFGDDILTLYQEPPEEPGANTFLAIRDLANGGYLMVTLGSAGSYAEALALADWAHRKLHEGGLPVEVTIADTSFQATLGLSALLRLAPVIDNLEIDGSLWVEMALAEMGH